MHHHRLRAPVPAESLPFCRDPRLPFVFATVHLLALRAKSAAHTHELAPSGITSFGYEHYELQNAEGRVQ
jgi:hypothetical protein